MKDVVFYFNVLELIHFIQEENCNINLLLKSRRKTLNNVLIK